MTLKCAKLLGKRVDIDCSWLLIIAIFTYSVSVGYFHRVYPWLSASSYWMLGITTSLIFIISLIAHELVHSFFAERFGAPVRKITLFPFGGITKTQTEAKSPREEFGIAASGPIFSLISAGFFWLVSGMVDSGSTIRIVLTWFSVANAFVAGLNLLPGFPLDGGRILRAGIWAETRDLKQATRITSRFGKVLGWGMFGFGILAFLHSGYLNGLWMTLVGWFLCNTSTQSYREFLLKKALDGLDAEKIITHRAESVSPFITMDQLVDEYFLKTYSDAYPVADDQGVKGLVTLSSLREVPREDWAMTYVGVIMKPISDKFIARPDDDAWGTVERMTVEQTDFLMVMSHGSVLGLISREDLWESLRARERE